MAEEKKTPEKQGWFKKLIGWFASLPGRIAKAFKNMVAELRKVTWPSKKKLISSCIIVLLFMLLTGLFVYLVDFVSASGVNALYNVGHPTESTGLTVEEDPSYVEEEETATTEGEATPAEGETATTEGETTPAESETATTEGETTPAEGETATTEGEATPVEGEDSVTTTEGDAE